MTEQSPQAFLDLSELAAMGRAARDQSESILASGNLQVLTCRLDSEDALIFSANATEILGAEMVVFCPSSRTGMAMSVMGAVGAALADGKIAFGQPHQVGSARFAAFPVLLPPTGLTPIGEALAEAMSDRPFVVIEIIPVKDTTPLHPMEAPLHIAQHGAVSPCPVQTAPELIDFRAQLSGVIGEFLAHLGIEPEASDEDAESSHPSFDGVADECFEPMDLDFDFVHALPAFDVPDFGTLTLRASVAHVGHHPDLMGAFEDDVSVIRASFAVDGTTIAQAQVTAFLEHPMDLSDHDIDLDWMSTFLHEDRSDSKIAVEAGWKVEAAAARVDGLWIAPAFRTHELIGAIHARLDALVRTMTADAEKIPMTYGLNTLRDGYLPEPMSDGEAGWYSTAYRAALGAIRSGPVDHGFGRGGHRVCHDHSRVYLVPLGG